MDALNKVFKVTFNYDTRLPDWVKPKVEEEYMRLRNLACEVLNAHYEEWNAEFDLDTNDVPDDDPLKDFGGTAYCDFIRKKQAPIISEINKTEANWLVKIFPGKTCDIEGMLLSSIRHRCLSKFYITLKPAN